MDERGRPRRTYSLSRRLVLAALVWIAVALALTGMTLAWLFTDHIERRFDASLADHTEELVAATEVSPDGTAMLTWRPADPRFGRPASGWYWQIAPVGGPPLATSDSLAGTALPLAAPARRLPDLQRLTGPGGEPLRARVQAIAFPGSPAPLVFTVTGPTRDVERDVARFTWPLATALSLLGLTLAVAVLAQVRFGLAPLARLRARLGEVRRGAAPRLGRDWPDEVAPLAGELNDLLDRHATRLARARCCAHDPGRHCTRDLRTHPGPISDSTRHVIGSDWAQAGHHWGFAGFCPR